MILFLCGFVDEFYVHEFAEVSQFFGNVAVTSLSVEAVCPVLPEFSKAAVWFYGDFCSAASVVFGRDECFGDLSGEVSYEIGVNEYCLGNFLADSHLYLRDGAFLTFHNGSDFVRSGGFVGAVHFSGTEAVGENDAVCSFVDGGVADEAGSAAEALYHDMCHSGAEV